jgi:hypothetical protein
MTGIHDETGEIKFPYAGAGNKEAAQGAPGNQGAVRRNVVHRHAVWLLPAIDARLLPQSDR